MAGYSSQDNGRSRYGELPPLPNFGQNPIYGRKPSQPEYIPYNKRGRDFYGRLSFNMGLLWLGGFTSGAVRGFVDGWRNAASPAYKIRFNSVMNGMSKTGALWGSTLGIVAFLHTCSVELCDMASLDSKIEIPEITPFIAGATTAGILFSSRGPRAATLAALGGAVASVGFSLASNQFERSTGAAGRF